MSLFDSASLVVTPNGVKEGKLYSIKPTDGSGDLDVVRNSSATRVNAEGLIETVGVNIARLDYTDSTCPSILVEPQRTNKLIQSESFPTSTYSYISLNRETGYTAPDGSNNAIRITNTGSGDNSGRAFLTSDFLLNDARTIYARTVSGTGKACLCGFYQNSFNNLFDLTEEWQRFELNEVISLGGTSFFLADFRSALTTVDDIIVWGGQVEAGTYATSYIPTVASAVTRNADVINLNDLQNKNVLSSDWTIYSEFIDYGNSNNNGTFVLGLKNITGTDWIGLYRTFTGALTFSKKENNGSVLTTPSLIQITNGNIIKVTIKCTSNNLKAYINGSLAYTSTFANPSLMTNFELSRIGSASNTTIIKSSLAFNVALTDQELEQLTTI